MTHAIDAELIGRLYGAIGNADLWQAWFERLCSELRVTSGALLLHSQWGVGHRGHFAVGIPDAFHGPAYAELVAADHPIYAAVLAGAPGEFHILSQHDAFATSRFYLEWMRPQGLRHLLGGIVHRTPEHVAGMGVIRRSNAAPFGDREIDLLHRVAPHLQRAIDLQQMLAAADLRQRTADQALDALRLAAALVDEQASLMAINERAEALLRASSGIGRDGNRIRAETARDTTELRRLVRDATRGSDANGGGVLAVSRGEESPPLLLFVSPSRPAATPSPWDETSTAIVLMSDPAELPQLPESGLCHLYGLTPAEARVAARIAQGASVDEIAAALSVAVSTVRTHLHRVLEKTGTSRQAELVRLLLTGPVVLAP